MAPEPTSNGPFPGPLPPLAHKSASLRRIRTRRTPCLPYVLIGVLFSRPAKHVWNICAVGENHGLFISSGAIGFSVTGNVYGRRRCFAVGFSIARFDSAASPRPYSNGPELGNDVEWPVGSMDFGHREYGDMIPRKFIWLLRGRKMSLE